MEKCYCSGSGDKDGSGDSSETGAAHGKVELVEIM